MSLIVNLPWPPSILSPNGRPGHWGQKARVTKETRKKAAEAAWNQGVDPVRGTGRLASVTFHPPNGRHDKDNCVSHCKATFDGLADAMGVNDRNFDPDFIMGEPVKGGAVVVEITDIPGE